MFSFLHAADIHLDSPLRNLARYEGAPLAELRSACRRAFVNLVDLAISERVAFLLIAGDLYDGDWKDYNTGLFFIGQMARLQAAGIRVCITAGNHDAASRLTRTLRLPENVHLFSHEKPESLALDCGVVVHGWSFPVRDVRDNMAQVYPVPDPHSLNIGMLHTALTGRGGHEPYAPCSREDLVRTGYDYWALGHVHAREEISRDPWIVFPGNIQGRHIRESGAKGASLVRVEGGAIASVEHHELAVLRWETCRFNGGGSAEYLLTRVGEALAVLAETAGGRNLAVRLEIEVDAAFPALRGEAGELLENEIRAVSLGLGGIWLEKIILNRVRDREREFLDGPSPQAGILRTLRELEQNPALLHALDPDLAELAAHLPANLSGGKGLLPDAPEEITRLLGDIRSLLLNGLGGTEE